VPYSMLPPGVNALRPNVTSVGSLCMGYGDERKLDPFKCRVKFFTRNRVCGLLDRSPGAWLVGWSTIVAGTTTKCICNAHQALCTRHGTRIGKERLDLGYYFKQFAQHLRPYQNAYAECALLERSCWEAKWPEQKRKAILKSQATELEDPGRVKFMVKWEVYHKEPTKSRGIQFYTNLATQAMFGPQFSAFAKTLIEAFNGQDEVLPGIRITFALGKDAGGIAAWADGVVADGYDHFYERDGKSWDATMSRKHSRFKERLMAIFDPELAQFVADCACVVGTAVGKDGVMRYTMNWTVKSGHNDTSSGNSLINAAIAACSAHRLGLRAHIIVMGDDLLMAVRGDFDLDGMIANEADYGIVPEAQKFDNIFDVSFISGIFIPASNGYGFCPIPGRLVSRLWWTIKKPTRKLGEYLNGVAAGLMPTCHGVPVVRKFMSPFRNGGKIGHTDRGYNYIGVNVDTEDDEMMLWAQGRYGLSRTDIVETESWLDSLPAEPLLLTHPTLTRIMEVDMREVDERIPTPYRRLGRYV
jgi:hypothetical protein